MLSKKAKYALVALVHMANRLEKGPVVVRDIAAEEHIPYKFLETIMTDLKRAAMLGSKRGKGGGYYFLKPPQEISLAEVMRIFDGPIALLPCVTYQYYERCEECSDEKSCGIRHAFFTLRNNMVDYLKGVSIASMVEQSERLKLGLQ
jgi:Rrf2 family protein